MSRIDDPFQKPDEWGIEPGLTEAPEMWEGAVGVWPYWEGGGAITNLVNGALSTPAGSPLWVPSIYGPSQQFPNDGDYHIIDAAQGLLMTLLDAGDTNDWSIFCICRDPGSSQNNGRGLYTERDAGSGVEIIKVGMAVDALNPDGWELTIRNSSNQLLEVFSTAQPFQDGNWHFVHNEVEGTGGSGNARIFLDDPYAADTDGWSNSNTFNDPNQDTWIANDPFVTTADWEGEISFIVAWSRLLSDQERISLFNNPFAMLRMADDPVAFVAAAGPATETLRPDGELSDSGLVANDETDHDEDPDSVSVTINATGNNTNTEWGGDFPTPTGNPTVGAGLQEFRVGVEEFDSGQSGTPNARIELWENGSLIRAGSDTPVSAYAVLSFTWNANELATADGSLVQCKLIGTKSGGSPTARNTVRIGHMEWNVQYDVAGATPVSASVTAGATVAHTMKVSKLAAVTAGATVVSAVVAVSQVAASVSAGATVVVAKKIGKLSAVTAGATAAVVKKISKSASATAGATAAATKKVSKSAAVTAGATVVASLIQLVQVAASVTAGATVGVTKKIAKSASVAAGATVATVKKISKSASVTAGATVVVAVQKVIQIAAAVTAGATVVVTKTISKSASATATATVGVVKKISKSAAVTAGATAAKVRKISKLATVTAGASVAASLKQVVQVAANVTAGASIVASNIFIAGSGAATRVVEFTRGVARGIMRGVVRTVFRGRHR